MPVLTTAPMIGGGSRLVDGEIAASATSAYVVDGNLVQPVAQGGIVRAGQFFGPSGQGAFTIPATPEGVGMRLVLLLVDDSTPARKRTTIIRTVTVPDVASVAWADLVDVVPPTSGEYIVPPWAADVFTAKNEVEAAAIAVESDKQAAAQARTAAEQARDDAQAVGASNDTIIAGRVNDPVSASTAALRAGYTAKPVAAERVVFVSPRGNDANDGRTLVGAKATIAAAIATLASAAGVIQLGAGTITTSATHTLPRGTQIVGAGRDQTTIVYTGTGSLFQTTAGTRTFNQRIRGLTLSGPGKASTAVAFDIADGSQIDVEDFLIATFGTGVKHRSDVIGGAVYNRFRDGFVTSCGIGVDYSESGSNGSRWMNVKFGACNIAVNIYDSNENLFMGCQFEVNTIAAQIGASLAGLSDGNTFAHCRFEQNPTAWNLLSATVRDTVIIPIVFGTYTYTDNGTRTMHLSTGNQAPPPGTKRYIITRSGSYTLLALDDVVCFNAASVTATLPDPAVSKTGRVYTVKNLHSSALTVNATAGTIDGAASISLTQWQTGRYISNGTVWYTIG